MIERTTPEHINSLTENQIFVFGSNLSGRHGKGAAKTALGWGAKWGQAKGLQGKTYGIPTKDASIRRTLTIEEIKPFAFRQPSGRCRHVQFPVHWCDHRRDDQFRSEVELVRDVVCLIVFRMLIIHR